jgi:hypothetical protein
MVCSFGIDCTWPGEFPGIITLRTHTKTKATKKVEEKSS